MRAEQNNYVLDGMDNNAVTVDYLGGASYLINPPPDALAEFKVSTSNYSAEFGHSAGAVVNASIKSGTNQIHGDLWEYFRNDFLDAHDWVTPPTAATPEYRQNQFGATLGFPLLKNHLFFFGDAQATVSSPGSRARGTGDFDANGMRAEQNNYVLDGMDNNAVTVDYLGGASYLINPPPDALAEFKVSTSNYSAEFGHSAGAVVNASIKSGTNQIHGDLWEYLRNDFLDAHDWVTPPTAATPEYRQNQFGATLGFPLLKNHLFFFGDAQANRIVIGVPQNPLTVPTAAERTGDFSQLLVPANIGASKPQTLYEPHNNQTVMSCPARAGQAAVQGTIPGENVLCPDQIDPAGAKDPQHVPDAEPVHLWRRQSELRLHPAPAFQHVPVGYAHGLGHQFQRPGLRPFQLHKPAR